MAGHFQVFRGISWNWRKTTCSKSWKKTSGLWWLAKDECCEEPPEISMCVVVGRVYQWYTLHIQMGKWWLHFAGKEHTFQESPQNHQICASVPESLQVQRADPWGSGSEVIKTHGIAWMGCVDLQWLNYEDYGYMIWILLPRKWLKSFGSKIPFPQKRRKPQDLKIWRIRVDTPKWRMHDCMACWLRTNCETDLPIERHVGPWIEMWVVVTKLLIWRGLKKLQTAH